MPSQGPSSICHSSACQGLSRTALTTILPGMRWPLKTKVDPEAAPSLEGPLGLTGPGTHLPGSLDIEVVEPLQDGDPGHHADRHVTEVAVQDLHNPIEVEGDWGPFGAVGKIREETHVEATGAPPPRPQRHPGPHSEPHSTPVSWAQWLGAGRWHPSLCGSQRAGFTPSTFLLPF